MGIAVLGPLQVGGQPNGLSPRDRVVLSALVVRAGDPISTDALADALWGDTPPPTWTKVVQGSVVRLRKRLGVAAIESESSGYRLALNEDELDHRLFERLLERGREALAGGDPARSAYVVQEALELWRGSTAFPDLEEWEPGRVEAARLAGLRLDAEELLVEAETASGHAPAVLEQARALVAQAPFRERRWALLATALYQSGRQAEALGAVKRARTMLVDELGLDPGRELVELEQLLLRQDPSLTPRAGREVSARLPISRAAALRRRGRRLVLRPRGRRRGVPARLRDTGVLTVVGPSGSGKSSLVRAGVVASLVRGGTSVLVTTPGARPMDSLTGLKDRGRQTLVVDQAEEVVTQCEDPAERERYFAALAAHVGAGGALVLSLRADHLGDLAPYPVIARVLEDGLYLLGPMSEPDLRRAIEGPARRSGLRLEPGLVDLLVREVEGEPAALPMLSHVLRETWERREGPTLTVDGYRATGGIRDAVSRSAESLYDAMDDSQRSRLRGLLLRLVMPTEDGDPVRARVPRSKIAGDDAHRRLVEQLVDARLVSIDGDNVQIAHEALVRVWPRLRGWLDDDVDGQRIFRHLAGAADAWDGMGRPESELYRGTRLGRTLEWRDRATPDLSDTETAFLDASVALSETELHAAEARIARERSVNRRLRGALVGVAVLLLVTAGRRRRRRTDRGPGRRRPGPGRARVRPGRATAARAGGSPPGRCAGAPARGRRHRPAARGRGTPGRLLGPGLGEPRRSPDPRRAVVRRARHRRPGRCTGHGLGGVDGGERGRQVGGREPAQLRWCRALRRDQPRLPSSSVAAPRVSRSPSARTASSWRSRSTSGFPRVGRGSTGPSSCTTSLAARCPGGSSAACRRTAPWSTPSTSAVTARGSRQRSASGTGRERRGAPGAGPRSGTWPARRSRSSASGCRTSEPRP